MVGSDVTTFAGGCVLGAVRQIRVSDLVILVVFHYCAKRCSIYLNFYNFSINSLFPDTSVSFACEFVLLISGER